MHYKDGTPVQVGDHVRGRGYNVRLGGFMAKKDDEPIEITGVVIGTIAGADSCNIRVAHAMPSNAGGDVPGMVAILSIEYGQADAFEYIGPRVGPRFPE